jgi:hypothetical protein
VLEQFRDNAVRRRCGRRVAVAVPGGELLNYDMRRHIQVRCDCLLDQERIGRLLAAT